MMPHSCAIGASYVPCRLLIAFGRIEIKVPLDVPSPYGLCVITITIKEDKVTLFIKEY